MNPECIACGISTRMKHNGFPVCWSCMRNPEFLSEPIRQHTCADCGKHMFGMDRHQIARPDNSVLFVCRHHYNERMRKEAHDKIAKSFEIPPNLLTTPVSWADLPEIEVSPVNVTYTNTESYTMNPDPTPTFKDTLRAAIGDPENLRWIATHLSKDIPTGLRQGYENYLLNIADAADPNKPSSSGPDDHHTHEN